jgi:hypothetical protein
MPGFDHKGPAGKGPRTGRGLGNCNQRADEDIVPDELPRGRWGNGRRGRGFGRGGRGFGQGGRGFGQGGRGFGQGGRGFGRGGDR